MQLQTGLYQHYKGNLYQVLHTARHSETEEWMVVYQCLYGDFSVWVRPLDLFMQQVAIDNTLQPRFKYLKQATNDDEHVIVK